MVIQNEKGGKKNSGIVKSLRYQGPLLLQHDVVYSDRHTIKHQRIPKEKKPLKQGWEADEI